MSGEVSQADPVVSGSLVTSSTALTRKFLKNFWFDPLTFAFHSGEWHAFGNSEAERYRHSVLLARAFRKFLRFLFSRRRFLLKTRLFKLVCEP